jgi:DNA-binding response OmpR family regulator
MANIILVDNEKQVARVIIDLLKAEGHSVKHCTSSKGLVAMMSLQQPNLIMIGIELEDEDGRTLSQRLYEEKLSKNIPVILISPFFHTESEIRKFHCADVISLPLEGENIISTVELYLTPTLKNKNSEPAHAEAII